MSGIVVRLFLFVFFLQFLNVVWGDVRGEHLERLRNETFDLLVIGGGATGSGIALDGATRGLKVALVERGDFSSGTSSRSTKLVHGGVRYLEQAIATLDAAQYALVSEALNERGIMLRNAPHLAKPIPLLTPLYEWWEGAYYWLGLKAYDWLSGSESLGRSHFVTAQRALELFPSLRKEGLQGGIVYYDGQFDDARFNLSLILTATAYGAAVANYVEVVDLIKDEGVVVGALVRDSFSRKEWSIRAKVVINATGAYADGLRKLDDEHVQELIVPSFGTHLVMDGDLAPNGVGLLIPKTDDGRVLFVLPWQGGALVGTTEEKGELSADPLPSEEAVSYLIEHLEHSLDIVVKKENIRAKWTGVRPLVRDPTVQKTAQLLRTHHIEVSPSRLITIVGGKWTIYRKMAEETVDKVIEIGGLSARNECVTAACPLVGAEGYTEGLWRELMESHGIENDVAKHLASAYGSLAEEVLVLAEQGYGKRLVEGYPYIEAEVIWAAEKEFAQTVEDVLKHRTRLFFLDQKASQMALPRVNELLSSRIEPLPS